MMAGEHPSESTLLEYVEDELDATSRAAVEAHLAECEACTADVTLSQAGRDTAREAPLFEAPATLSGRVLGEIKPRPSPRVAAGGRWLRIVAPVAAALTLAGGIATVAVLDPGGGGDDGGGDAAMAEEADRDAAGGELAPSAGKTGGEGAQEESLSGAYTLKRVAANPDELARELKRRGFRTLAAGSTVVVATTRDGALRQALKDYPNGAVRVLVAEP